MKTLTTIFFCILFCKDTYAQFVEKKYDKAFTLSSGVINIPRLNNIPYILQSHFQNTGSMIAVGMDLRETAKGSHHFYTRYGFLASMKDSIVTSPSGLDPNSFEKYYDLHGYIHVLSFGYSWQRYFGHNLKLQPYTFFGVENLLQLRETQTGYFIADWLPSLVHYENPGYTVISLNLRLGFGFRHKLTEKLTLFETAEAGTMLFHRDGPGVVFSPLQPRKEFLFYFAMGISYKFDW